MPKNNKTQFNPQQQWMSVDSVSENNSILDELAEIYKRNILHLISLCKNKVVVFDFDGTLTEFKYDKNTLLPCKDVDINEYFRSNNFYTNCRTLKTMQFILETLSPLNADEVYVLSVSQPNVCKPKLEKIKKDFSIFIEENIYQVRTTDEKLSILEMLHKKHNKEIVFIEDTAKTLLNAEECFPFVYGYHISSLIP
jgi:hypothetical protein